MAYQSRKKKKQKDFKVRFRVWSMVLLGVCMFYGLYFFSRYEEWQFQEIIVEGDERADVEQIEKEVWHQMSSPWWHVIGHTNKVFFPKKQIIQSILAEHSIIEKVTLETSQAKILVISVVERGPEYVACPQAREEESMEDCLFVDYEGYAYGTFEYDVVHDAILVEKEYIKAQIPYALFSQKEKEYFVKIKDSLRDVGEIQRIVYLPNETTDVYLGEDFYIRFIEHLPVFEQISNIETVLGSDLSEISFDEYGYIDARFPGKVYLYEKVSSKIELGE